MEILERIWEIVTAIGNAILGRFERGITTLFGSANARFVRRQNARIEAINALEPKYQTMSDAELKAQTVEFRRRLAAGETLDDLLVEAFAVCREAGRRFLGMRHYDVQLIGGIILHEGNIAEMVTGEGKTLVATLPAYLNALKPVITDDEGNPHGSVHVVTVNDYLARRDMEWMGPIYTGLGLTVGAIQGGMESGERQKVYDCDITYGTNNEFGFDYLRDNMRIAARGDDRYPKHHQQAQGHLNYAIVDEVDNILIDEARTPLIISGPAEDDITKYQRADKVARQLKKDVHFEVKEKEHTANLTDEGVREAERLAGVESFYTAGNMQWPHLIDNSLKAHHLYQLDVNYVVQDRRGRDRRRVHRAADARPPLERRPAPGGRGQRRRPDQGRESDARHDHAAKLLQALQEDLRHDGHGPHRGGRILEDLQARRDRRPDQPPDEAGQLPRRDLSHRARKVRRHRRRNRADQPLDHRRDQQG